MSLNSAMQTGVSGLNANSAALATVSNNIANVNTVGYKQSETDFETLVTGTGATRPLIRGGVLASNRQLVDQQGRADPDQVRRSTWRSPARVSSSPPARRPTSRRPTRACSPAPVRSRSTTRATWSTPPAWCCRAGPPTPTATSAPTPPASPACSRSMSSQVGGAVSPTTTVGVNANVNSAQAVSAAARRRRANAGRRRRLQPGQQQHGAVGEQQRHRRAARLQHPGADLRLPGRPAQRAARPAEEQHAEPVVRRDGGGAGVRRGHRLGPFQRPDRHRHDLVHLRPARSTRPTPPVQRRRTRRSPSAPPAPRRRGPARSTGPPRSASPPRP